MTIEYRNKKITRGEIFIKVPFKEQIGLDHAVLSGFRITALDFSKLEKRSNVSFECDGEFLYWLADGRGFRWLKIEDPEHFGTLIAGVRKRAEFKQDYTRLELRTRDPARGNLQNLTVEQYKDYLIDTFEYLYAEYGIFAELSNIKFSMLEINCTFSLTQEFRKYHRVLRLLMFNLPQSFSKLGQVQKVNKEGICLDAETFYRSNSSTGIKIYDKKKQMEDTSRFVLSEQIMRIEITLKTAQKVQEVFGSNRVMDLSDDKINEYFYQQFEKLFVKKYRKWQKQNGKFLHRMILKHKEMYKRNWQKNLLAECSDLEQRTQIPVLLGINELLPHIKALDQHRHYSRVVKSIMKCCEYNSTYLQNDEQKIEEIFQKVHAVYINYCESMELRGLEVSPLSGDVA